MSNKKNDLLNVKVGYRTINEQLDKDGIEYIIREVAVHWKAIYYEDYYDVEDMMLYVCMRRYLEEKGYLVTEHPVLVITYPGMDINAHYLIQEVISTE